MDLRSLALRADLLRAGADRRSPAPRPLAARLLQQRRHPPEPHGAVAPAVPAHLLVLLHVLAPRGVGALVLRSAFVCFFCFLIGCRTRLFHVLSFVMTTSLHNRILFAENWGGVAIGALMVWTVVPAARAPVLRRRRAAPACARGPTRRPSELAAGLPPPDNAPAHLAGGARAAAADRDHLLVQLRPQSGPTWRDGTRGLLRPAAGADRHLAGPAGPRARSRTR